MKVLGRAAGTAQSSLSDGSIRAAWLRVGLTAMLAVVAVLCLQVASSEADDPFAPTVTLATSTTLAAAHPDARITITNPGTEDLKSIQLDLPDGMWGSLAAVPDLCPWANAEAGTCPATSEVGTIAADAKIDDSDSRLRGKVFMTEPDPDSPDADKGPAWLSIVLRAKVGGVDFGNVITPGRVELRHNQAGVPVNANGPIYGPAIGLRTIVDDIPRTITDDNSSRQLTFHVEKMQLDLRSDQTAPQLPLLTNSSKCTTTQVATVMTSYDAESATPSDDYEVTGCEDVKVRGVETSFELSNPVAGENTDLVSTVDFGETTAETRKPTLSSATLLLPPLVSTNFSEMGNPTDDQCSSAGINFRRPSLSTPTAQPFFRSPSITWTSANCPPGAKIGSAQIWTPLLPEPVMGDVWAIGNSPLPHVVIDVNPSITGNPAGVYLTIIGESSSGPAVDGLATSVKVSFGALPDAPVSKLEVTIDEAPIEDAGDVGTSRELLAVGPLDDPVCQPDIDFSLSMSSHAGASASGASVSSEQVTGCQPSPVTVGAPAGSNTSSSQPVFAVTNTSTFGSCIFRPGPVQDLNCPAGTTNASPATPLADGLRALHIPTSDMGPVGPSEYQDDRRDQYRYFAVDSSVEPESDAPQTTLTADPGNPTSDTTPTFDFSSDESALFECALDGGAFLHCGDAALATTGTHTLAEPLFVNEDEHTFEVRARDAVGNVDPSPASFTFSVDLPFEPTASVNVFGNTQARAHPDLDVTIANASHDDLDELRLRLPNGFFGGLTGVQALCSRANESTGNCGVSSQVGTVLAAAQVDESIVRLPGQIYLTEPDPANVGDPAALLIKIPAVIQSVDMGDVLVRARLIVRGQAEGVDSLSIDIPDRIEPDNGLDTLTLFDMREITLKLRTGQGATHPLLTNPSTCAADTFNFSYKSKTPVETAQSSVPFQSTGCGALGFGPRLAVDIRDAKSGLPPKAFTPADPVSATLTASLTANPGDAGIKHVSILLPKPFTISPQLLPPVCTREQFNADACPEVSRVGSVSAVSPLLPEALTGSVYLLKADPASGRSLPEIYLRLRGRINLDLIGTNRFENVSQIRAEFANLPDVALSSFTMSVDKLITTRNEACDSTADQRNLTGTLSAQNGSAAGVSQALSITCPPPKPKIKANFTNRGKRSTLSVDVKAAAGVTMKSVSIRLPKGLKMVKKAIKRKAPAKSGNRKLATKCLRYRKTNQLDIGFCKKASSRLRISFKSGSLNASSKKLKRPKLKFITVDSNGNKTTQTITAR